MIRYKLPLALGRRNEMDRFVLHTSRLYISFVLPNLHIVTWGDGKLTKQLAGLKKVLCWINCPIFIKAQEGKFPPMILRCGGDIC